MPIRPLGKVAVAAAGTPVQLYTGTDQVRGKCIIVKALNGNAGTVYVGGANMNKGTLVGVSADLVPGASATYPAHEGNPLSPDELWVDADNNNDAVLVTVVGG